MGFEVLTASTVAEALTSLTPPPDCLILDLRLPDGDGEIVLRKIRKDGLETHVTICTGVHEQERLEALKDLEPDALLLKPIDLDRVVGTYSSFIAR